MSFNYKITIVRHGETDLNLKHTCQGHIDAVLNDTGCKQALHAGKILSTEKFSHVFCSDLLRAKKTCENILSQNDQYNKESKEIVTDKRIRERSFGVFEGRPIAEFYELAKKAQASFMEYTPEGAESLQDMMSRAESFLRDLFDQIYNENKQCKDGEQCANILIVTHGGFVRYLLNVLADDYGCVNDNKNMIMFNCARTVLLCTVTSDSESIQFSNNVSQPCGHTTLVKCLLFNAMD